MKPTGSSSPAHVAKTVATLAPALEPVFSTFNPSETTVAVGANLNGVRPEVSSSLLLLMPVLAPATGPGPGLAEGWCGMMEILNEMKDMPAPNGQLAAVRRCRYDRPDPACIDMLFMQCDVPQVEVKSAGL